MAKSTEELTVITKTYDLILWSCNHTSRFPRNHRFVSTACFGRKLDWIAGRDHREYIRE